MNVLFKNLQLQIPHFSSALCFRPLNFSKMLKQENFFLRVKKNSKIKLSLSRVFYFSIDRFFCYVQLWNQFSFWSTLKMQIYSANIKAAGMKPENVQDATGRALNFPSSQSRRIIHISSGSFVVNSHLKIAAEQETSSTLPLDASSLFCFPRYKELKRENFHWMYIYYSPPSLPIL